MINEKEMANREEFEEKIAQIIKTDEYIKWMGIFTKKYSSFFVHSEINEEDEFSKEDCEKISMLPIFFAEINKFAIANYIFGEPCYLGKCYYIKYNENIYKIAWFRGNIYYCELFKNCNVNKYILFEDILKPDERLLVRTATIENQLQRIDDLLDELYRKGIPNDAIKLRVNTYLSENNKYT